MINRQDAKGAKKGLIMENKKCFKTKCLDFTWRPWRLGGGKEMCL
jgi:hypothetical protein